MDRKSFNEAIESINEKSYNYGNDILYSMAKNPDDLFCPEKRNGAMWIIGRSYAASPQRRSYGTYQDPTTGKKQPICPVKTANDGRENFFDYISKKIDLSFFNDSLIHSLKDAYQYDGSVLDIERQVAAIGAVLKFNLELSKAIESFDGVENNINPQNGKLAYCSNHISFSSKFLHFYFPNTVFIIDNFAFNGGKALYNGKVGTRDRYFSLSNTDEHNCFEQSVYDNLACYKTRGNELFYWLKKQLEAANLINEYNSRLRKRTEEVTDGDSSKADDYIYHFARSYYLGQYIQKLHISPVQQIKTSDILLAPMPRLTDAVFLNIKSASKSEKDK